LLRSSQQRRQVSGTHSELQAIRFRFGVIAFAAIVSSGYIAPLEPEIERIFSSKLRDQASPPSIIQGQVMDRLA
jgi:hypothetical protein